MLLELPVPSIAKDCLVALPCHLVTGCLRPARLRSSSRCWPRGCLVFLLASLTLQGARASRDPPDQLNGKARPGVLAEVSNGTDPTAIGAPSPSTEAAKAEKGAAVEEIVELKKEANKFLEEDNDESASADSSTSKQPDSEAVTGESEAQEASGQDGEALLRRLEAALEAGDLGAARGAVEGVRLEDKLTSEVSKRDAELLIIALENGDLAEARNVTAKIKEEEQRPMDEVGANDTINLYVAVQAGNIEEARVYEERVRQDLVDSKVQNGDALMFASAIMDGDMKVARRLIDAVFRDLGFQVGKAKENHVDKLQAAIKSGDTNQAELLVKRVKEDFFDKETGTAKPQDSNVNPPEDLHKPIEQDDVPENASSGDVSSGDVSSGTAPQLQECQVKDTGTAEDMLQQLRACTKNLGAFLKVVEKGLQTSSIGNNAFADSRRKVGVLVDKLRDRKKADQILSQDQNRALKFLIGELDKVDQDIAKMRGQHNATPRVAL